MYGKNDDLIQGTLGLELSFHYSGTNKIKTQRSEFIFLKPKDYSLAE